ncbi:AAA domain-containing protein [Janthinobacterium sp. NKUCC06_STL]|uniref:AAA domain-containing protein n=1 Tax=Janthinobacterium sp. NKUCC06_STL TaxID=2842127 RepID=UPI001C5AFFF5|nr:AAA domain-containing protein [Janthinobacterium sp. NKUCC06_STL]MBW3510599.1 AAA family ATPase [Janthinobacterium sp. NKUCC06_STL]
MTITKNAAVIEVLDYIKHVETLTKSAPIVVPTEYFAVLESEMRAIPGLEFNQVEDGDDVWLRVPRLMEVNPPPPQEELMSWLILSKLPTKEPELRKEVMIKTSKKADSEAASLKLVNFPEIKELFEWYVEHLWTPWAIVERERRKTMVIYAKLFSLQQHMTTEGAETPIELVWGIGHTIWKPEGKAKTIKHPLITQLCDLTLNDRNYALEVRPRDTEPRLELDCYAEIENSGVPAVMGFWKADQTASANSITPYDSNTFDRVLKNAVANLDANGRYTTPEDRSMPEASESLCVTDTWVFYARKRSEHILLQDIERLISMLEGSAVVPDVIRSFVERGSTEVKAPAKIVFRGLSSSSSAEGVRELYFPLPYNDEQVAIVQQLETGNGSVVQGPPGTGKTHTIANIISHYLAQGKRVLVTSKGEAALSVVQEKLPESIRPLCVALLSEDKAGMKQFEASIQEIATRVSALQPARVAQEISNSERHLDEMHRQLVAIDTNIAEFARQHMSKFILHGKEMNPPDLAHFVLDNEEIYSWLDDVLDAGRHGNVPFAESDIAAAHTARVSLKKDIAYLSAKLPAAEDFCFGPELATLHNDLVRARQIESKVKAGDTLPLVDATLETFQKAESLAPFLEAYLTLQREVADYGHSWVSKLSKAYASIQPDVVLLQLNELLSVVDELEACRRNLMRAPVELAANAELHEDFIDALGRLTQGRSPFSLPFGKKEAREIINTVTVSGERAANKQAWQAVAATCELRKDVRQLVARWNAVAEEYDLPHVETGTHSLRQLTDIATKIGRLREFVQAYEVALPAQVEAVFGRRVPAATIAEIGQLLASLSEHFDKNRLNYAGSRVAGFQAKLEHKSGAIVIAMSAFLRHEVGNAARTPEYIGLEWTEKLSELRHVLSLRDKLDTVSQVASRVENSGAPKWAARLRLEPALGEIDPVTPTNWLEAWYWRCARTFLDSIDVHEKLKKLQEQRHETERSLSTAYKELISAKTWLGVYNNSPESVQQALQQYLNSIQSVGRGTGIRAIRHRRNAREAMTRAYSAVPCWVMPQWRVSESIPAELGLFDLVIVDESSQSDIWAFPVLLRGKKLLIVGDHKQVSPGAVGMAEEKIKDLHHRFLAKQPHGSEMTPDKSIYDLARVVFAGNSTMLKEHFRCVPAIIEFSNREFYQNEIRPLRIPSRSQRLDPPLIDVYVKSGYRKGDINPPEADAIIDEIECIIADPTLVGRTIGVVTLQGTTQAAHIHGLLHQRIPMNDILERHIMVGTPPTFQGGERDIMLVSMVSAKGDKATSSAATFEQRYNVAASRARERMMLFRSVDDADMKSDDLRSKLIRHFSSPFTQDAHLVSNLRDLCDSGFEREVYDILTTKGYRVKPQVKVGGYKIDFVVEGAEDRRLAIELDGDRFHGPGQWLDDMTRQRVLERAGWTFWRCFASSYYMRKDEVLGDLFATLAKMGIDAIGAESVDNTRYVEKRIIDPSATIVPEQVIELHADGESSEVA